MISNTATYQSNLQLPAFSYKIERGTKAYQQQETSKATRAKWINEWLFLHAALPCYSDIILPKEKINLVIKGFVGKDGLGDYFHIKHAADRIQQKYPKWKIQLVLEVQNLFKMHREDKFPKDPSCIVYGTLEETHCLEEPTIFNDNSINNVHVFRTACDVVKGADCVIDMPHCDSTCTIFAQSSLNIVEYGPRMQKFPKRFPMGINPFEFGLFISQLKEKKEPLDNLDKIILSSFLNDHLFIEKEGSKQQLYFGYSHTTAISYFLSSCVAASTSGVSSAIVLFSIPISFPYDFKKFPSISEKYVIFLKKWNVKEVQFWEISSQGGKQSYEKYKTVTIQNEGITIYALDPFPLSNHDMRLLMSHAVTSGCTGDMSLSESIEEMSLFDYEIRKHKSYFFKDLIVLAEEFFKEEEDPPFVSYLKALQSRSEKDFNSIEKVGMLAAQTKTHEQARLFYKFIYDYHNFEPIFFDLIHRQIIHNQFSIAQVMEADLKNDFIEDKTNLGEALMDLNILLTAGSMTNLCQEINPWIGKFDEVHCFEKV